MSSRKSLSRSRHLRSTAESSNRGKTSWGMHALAPSRSSLSPLLFDLSTREPPHPRPPSALTSCAVICHATSAGPTVLPVAVSSTSTVVAKRMWCGHCGRVSTRSGRVAGASVAPGVVENSHRGLCYSQTGFLVQRGRSPDTSGGLPRRVHTRLRLLPTRCDFYMPLLLWPVGLIPMSATPVWQRHSGGADSY